MQIGIYFDGRIAITWLGNKTLDGLAGVSEGLGLPQPFAPSDFLVYEKCVDGAIEPGVEGEGEGEGEPECTTPSAPAEVEATDGALSNAVRVIWSPVSGATEYQVYRAELPSFAEAEAVSAWITDFAFDDQTALPPEVFNAGCFGGEGVLYYYYYYWVVARDTSSCVGPPSVSNVGHVGLADTKSVFEKALPAQPIANSDMLLIQTDSALSIRLRTMQPDVVVPASVKGLVTWTGGSSSAVQWRPIGDGSDGWVVYEPAAPWTPGDVVTMTVEAVAASGLPAGPLT
jgi:hypothetical protein